MNSEFVIVFSAALALLLSYGQLAEASTFTDHFEGQGRGCWGDLWIRTKTIQWNTDWSMCNAPYTIVKDTLEKKPRDFEYILYKLDRPSKNCSWSYIGLYFYDFVDYPDSQNHWSAVGFPTLNDYLIFDEHARLTGTWTQKTPGLDTVLFCDFVTYF